jgi:hypothetical protein
MKPFSRAAFLIFLVGIVSPFALGESIDEIVKSLEKELFSEPSDGMTEEILEKIGPRPERANFPDMGFFDFRILEAEWELRKFEITKYSPELKRVLDIENSAYDKMQFNSILSSMRGELEGFRLEKKHHEERIAKRKEYIEIHGHPPATLRSPEELRALPEIGLTQAEYIRAYGIPDNRSKTRTTYGSRTMLVYEIGNTTKYVHVENGIVTAITTQDF